MKNPRDFWTGIIYVADSANHTIRKITPGGAGAR